MYCNLKSNDVSMTPCSSLSGSKYIVKLVIKCKEKSEIFVKYWFHAPDKQHLVDQNSQAFSSKRHSALHVISLVFILKCFTKPSSNV